MKNLFLNPFRVLCVPFASGSPAAVAVTVVLAGFAGAAMGGCETPVGRDIPARTLTEAGLSARPWITLNESLDAAGNEVRALLVVRGCTVVFERYKAGVGREHNHTLYSVTKSVSSTLVGALLYEGKLKSLDQPIAELVPPSGRIPAENWAKAQNITLRNVMQMASGLAYRHDPAGHPIYDPREDRFAYALTAPQEVAPGTRFLYSDGDVSMTGAAIAGVAQDDLLSYARKALFEPLQMANVAWMFRDRTGRYPGGWGLRLRPMDMAKLGQLYLQQGEWNGRRIFAADYPAQAWRAGPSPVYGLHWWIGVHANARGAPYFWANGFKGQRIYIFPSHDAVVVVSASLPRDEEGSVTTQVIKALADSVADGPDAADAGTEAQVKAIAAKGFRGTVRIQQENQDDPRRF